MKQQVFSLKTFSILTTLFLLFTTLSSTAFAKTVTETKTFRGGTSGRYYKKSEACQTKLKKYEKQRIEKACSRVKGKLKIDNIDCDCSQNKVDQWHCKKPITATCTYDSKNMKPSKYGSRELFGIKKKPSNKITQTQVFKIPGRLKSSKSCSLHRSMGTLDAQTGCHNIAGKIKLLKFNCECITVAPKLYECVGLLKASCTFDKSKIKAHKELDPWFAKSRYGWGILENMVKE